MQKTVSSGCLQGKAHQVVEILKQKCKPSNVSVKIELDQELKKVKFNNAINYYNDIIEILAWPQVSNSEID